MIFGFNLVFRQVDNRVVLLDLDQHLLAILRNLEVVDLSDDGFLTVLETERTEMSLAGLAAVAAFLVIIVGIGRSATEIKNPVINEPDIAVVTGHDGKPDNSISDAIEIDFHHDRLLRFDVLGLVFSYRGCSFRLSFLSLGDDLSFSFSFSFSLFFSALPTSSLFGASGDSVSFESVTR